MSENKKYNIFHTYMTVIWIQTIFNHAIQQFGAAAAPNINAHLHLVNVRKSLIKTVYNQALIFNPLKEAHDNNKNVFDIFTFISKIIFWMT